MALLTENEQFHLKIKKGDVGRYAILFAEKITRIGRIFTV